MTVLRGKENCNSLTLLNPIYLLLSCISAGEKYDVAWFGLELSPTIWRWLKPHLGVGWRKCSESQRQRSPIICFEGTLRDWRQLPLKCVVIWMEHWTSTKHVSAKTGCDLTDRYVNLAVSLVFRYQYPGLKICQSFLSSCHISSGWPALGAASTVSRSVKKKQSWLECSLDIDYTFILSCASSAPAGVYIIVTVSPIDYYCSWE